MSRFVFKLPDLGEGTVTAEIVAWHVKPGDPIAEDQPLAEMSTEKAVVEVPSPVTGRVVSLAGKPGESVAVGAELVVFDTGAEAGEASADVAAAERVGASPAGVAPAAAVTPPSPAGVAAGRVRASPATRRRAHEAGIDLTQVRGSGPGGRIRASDLAGGGAAVPGVEEIEVIGVRRLIAQRMSEAKRTIPHFSYVEEVDVTDLETLRMHLNGKLPPGAPSLTYLPFVVAALARTLRDFPQCNAHYDADRNVIRRFAAVHVGVATQTPDGLKVPVVRDAQSLGLHDLAAGIRRVSEAARANRARREELTGSTITVTSLGKLGGIVSTPILNAPEVAIIGVNKAVERPVVHRGAIVVRRIMNLSSSFDHRFVDGFDAAAMIQALKERLEHPATVFVD
jgi:2-oxoisovalerate dehydrogenase E2 component (dihydrolipoyl transacylase)